MQHKQTSAAALLERLPIILVWLAGTAFVMAGLPAVPVETPDSISYIEIAANRPPAYGWMLHALKAAGLVGTDYAGLPLIQTAMIAAGLLAFTLWLARLLAAPWASLATGSGLGACGGTYEATRWLASEALFLLLMLFGLTASIAYACRDRPAYLLAATVLFGLAALTRTSGLALLLLPLLLVALDGRLRLGAIAKRSAAVIGVAAILMLGGMWANMLRHGHFEIGSNSGVSLLGKGMLLLQPGPHGNPVLDDMAPRAAQARAAIAAAPDTAASLRAQAQAYEELRWRGFFERAETVWPEVTVEPWRETNIVSGQVARAIIAERPLAYLRLVARDWLALVIYPHLWPVAGTENARLAPFDDCDSRPLECWALVRLDIPRPYALAMLAVSAAGHAATLVLIVGWGVNAFRRRLAAPERVMFSVALWRKRPCWRPPSSKRDCGDTPCRRTSSTSRWRCGCTSRPGKPSLAPWLGRQPGSRADRGGAVGHVVPGRRRRLFARRIGYTGRIGGNDRCSIRRRQAHPPAG